MYRQKPNLTPYEAHESQTLMEYLRLKGYRFSHIKNEAGLSNSGKRVRNWKAVWDAKDGVSKGFPDFAVIADNKLVFIELKRVKGSHTSQEQKDWIAALNEAGIPAKICKGASAAIDFIEEVRQR